MFDIHLLGESLHGGCRVGMCCTRAVKRLIGLSKSVAGGMSTSVIMVCDISIEECEKVVVGVLQLWTYVDMVRRMKDEQHECERRVLKYRKVF
jgi:hypothetical protein